MSPWRLTTCHGMFEPINASVRQTQFALAELAGDRFAEVENASFRRFERQYLNDVRPAQLCSQRRHNPEIRELFGKLHHAV